MYRYVPDNEELESGEENVDYIQQGAIPKRSRIPLEEKTVLSLNVATIAKAQEQCPKNEGLVYGFKTRKECNRAEKYKDIIFVKRGQEFKIYLPTSLI